MRRAIEWPDGKLVCCTFQVALEAFRKKGAFKKDTKVDINYNSLSHASYGGKVGAWKLIEVFKRNQIRATILVNGLAAEKWPDAVRALHDAGHEIAAHGVTNVTLETGDAARGWDRHAPYDAIVVTGSMPVLPDAFPKSLRPGGRLIVVVGEPPVMEAQLITCVAAGAYSTTGLFETCIAPLRNAVQPERFVF